ncbi:OLC1v1029045C1 [Oldenlandia corymbosa var. corymbosa]|uniref:OLC1v1029045C1 n=1 Tax=Oldenlandia corymbosa var. corymbosa TaxID=529605 RepID=A0AAV1CEU5_OLDCO|nr:OLC1v1029045C1 [Oldenlandia corymbosa var. corymbosa]
MYIKSKLACLVENRRLLLLVALLFALVVSVQYFELPYGNAFFSLFYAGKAQFASVGNLLAGNSSGTISSAKPSVDWNSTSSGGLNSTDHTNETNATKVSDVNDTTRKHSVDSSSGPEDEIPSTDFMELNKTSMPEVEGTTNLVPGKASDESEIKPDPNISVDRENENADHPSPTPSFTVRSSDSHPPFRAPVSKGTDSGAPMGSVGHNASSSYKDENNTIHKTDSPGLLKTNPAPLLNYSSVNSSHNAKRKSKNLKDVVVSLPQMNEMFISSLTSYRAKKPRWVSKSDKELIHAKSLIWSSHSVRDDPSLHAPLFRNLSKFKRSYELMEQTLKVYIYKEGKRPIFHTPVLKGIYASEGWFMKLLKGNKKFVTKNPEKAHLFYLPFSSRMLEETLYSPDLHSRSNLVQHLSDYLSLLSSRYSFWNRTGGADHFLVACHDWAPAETEQIMANCIRALCNSDITKEGFQFGKDVALAETSVRSAQNPLKQLGGHPPSQRSILAFFAGRMHGDVRPILLQHWQGKDPDMKIFGKMERVKGQMNYVDHMKSSKYCICAKGYEVNSPRVIEAIFYDCVPVIISDNFVPPFFETFKWESFAVFVPEKDIPNLKNILVSIPEKKYLELQRNVKLAQQHFLWHFKPVKYDIFHMILHSIWYTRVFQSLKRESLILKIYHLSVARMSSCKSAYPTKMFTDPEVQEQPTSRSSDPVLEFHKKGFITLEKARNIGKLKKLGLMNSFTMDKDFGAAEELFSVSLISLPFTVAEIQYINQLASLAGNKRLLILLVLFISSSTFSREKYSAGDKNLTTYNNNGLNSSADHIHGTSDATKFPDDKDATGKHPSGHDASSVMSKDEVQETEKNDGVLKRMMDHSSSSNKSGNVSNVIRSSETLVVSLSQMNEMFVSNLTSYRAKKPQWASKSDQEMLVAKSLIWSSPDVENDPSLHAPLFRNFSMFKRSYELMEQTLKVYIYTEGETPIFHTPVLRGIYASEGWFMKLLKENKKFVTRNPKDAHLFYLPFSSWMLKKTLYVQNSSNSQRDMVQYLNNYISLISSRYEFWNRTGGADHFFVACQDSAPAETKRIMANCIRGLCNSDIVKEGFQFGKDVPLVETFVRLAQDPLKGLGGKPASKRKFLAFFGGNNHGYLRPILLQHWQDKDPDMKIFGRMTELELQGHTGYIEYMKNTRYCICAKGYEVNSPRVAEAIFYECVPVIISDNFIPPFFETFNWESFSVFVAEKDIPDLKNILVSIPEDKYLELQRNVKMVQHHFLWHFKPVKYDIFHMILHSIWFTRVFQIGST